MNKQCIIISLFFSLLLPQSVNATDSCKPVHALHPNNTIKHTINVETNDTICQVPISNDSLTIHNKTYENVTKIAQYKIVAGKAKKMPPLYKKTLSKHKTLHYYKTKKLERFWIISEKRSTAKHDKQSFMTIRNKLNGFIKINTNNRQVITLNIKDGTSTTTGSIANVTSMYKMIRFPFTMTTDGKSYTGTLQFNGTPESPFVLRADLYHKNTLTGQLTLKRDHTLTMSTTLNDLTLTN